MTSKLPPQINVDVSTKSVQIDEGLVTGQQSGRRGAPRAVTEPPASTGVWLEGGTSSGPLLSFRGRWTLAEAWNTQD